MSKPQETLLKSEFDIVIKSTNVDFVMLELCKELKSKNYHTMILIQKA